MASRDRSAQAPFLAMHDLLDDAAALVTRYGSISKAAERLDDLERENAELRAALDANSTHIAGLEARAQLSPGKVVAILQRACTCVGDVSLLETMLEEGALVSSAAASAKSGVRVVLSVHQVELDGVDAARPRESNAPVGFSPSNETLASPLEDVKPSKMARETLRRPRKRLRYGKRSTADRPPETLAPQWTDRIQGQIRAWRSVVGINGERTTVDALGAGEDAPGAGDAVGAPAITRRDQIDMSPGAWAQLGVEAVITRLGEKALAWSPPEELMDEIEERQRDPPTLTAEAFAALDAARPWDLVYLRRCDVSYTFDYRVLQPKGKAFVRAVRWFQFEFRRELWEWMHWIPMAPRRRSPEWEAYRRGRNDRSNVAIEAWHALCSDAIKLVRDEVLPVDFFLDPLVWVLRYYQWLAWKPAGMDLVAAQAVEDARHPARGFYLTNLDEHPFFGSPFSQLYTVAHALPRLTDVDGRREVHIDPAGAGQRPCPTSWGTTQLAPMFRVVTARPSASSGTADVKPCKW